MNEMNLGLHDLQHQYDARERQKEAMDQLEAQKVLKQAKRNSFLRRNRKS